MDHHASYINNRLSLRRPQSESLEILAQIANRLSLRKDCDLAAEQESILALTETLATDYGTARVFTGFERNFPCCCFSLATGVGKTRLMGAFITWLHQAKGINNFFVLAPSLTIYTKLIEDFSNPRSPKYVFPGIGDYVHRPPGIITGDNYASRGTLNLFDESININILNISKIKAETKGDKQPRIKRLAEYIGQSYFDYLANLDDLVILMDESHHYRAERGMQVINELRPVLGIELTATPKTETGGTKLFKNVVYQYGLGAAIEDGFVKEPAVATRKDFDPSQKGEEKDENIQQLLTLENADNKIEIVIHVNMLKEGWDVTNLYTIIPLRISASETLTEQTLGRGLRLPYGGQRTGNDKVDKLTIIAHDQFQRIIEEANKPGSIIKQKNSKITFLKLKPYAQRVQLVVDGVNFQGAIKSDAN